MIIELILLFNDTFSFGFFYYISDYEKTNKQID